MESCLRQNLCDRKSNSIMLTKARPPTGDEIVLTSLLVKNASIFFNDYPGSGLETGLVIDSQF